jgi:hypothetical protein
MKHFIAISLCMLFAATTVVAFPIDVSYNDGPQDPLIVPPSVHELGIAPAFSTFPDELIGADDSPTDITVCFDTSTPDDPCVMNTLVTMQNLTPVHWKDVWYVADWEETTHSNYDGWIGGPVGTPQGTAFHIDSKLNNPAGIHNPLVFESMILDDIFQPGETWQFVIQDYRNSLGKPASLLGSIGVPSAPITADSSSGSIIAIAVPGPTTVALLCMGGLLLSRRRKS